MRHFTPPLCLLLALIGVRLAHSQVATNVPPLEPNAKPATVQIVTIHGASLMGNLAGEATDRDAVVVLPPGYASHPQRRYPVIYALHGYSIGAQQWIHEIHVPQTLEGAFAKGAREMIVVFPDSKTAYNGSFYSRSATTGDFESYVVHDVVQYIDSHYRTLANRLSRGLVGHSMGGYGAARLGMRHPEVFGALYIMSGCCLSPMQPQTLERGEPRRHRGDEVTGRCRQSAVPGACHPGYSCGLVTGSAPTRRCTWTCRSRMASLQADVLAKWAANAPLAFFDQAVSNLRQYTAIAIDAGDQDGLRVDAAKFHEALDSLWHPQHLRDLSGHAYQQCGVSDRRTRAAVFQSEPEI